MTDPVHTFGTCPVCKRRIGTYVPAGGDGTCSVMRPHQRTFIHGSTPMRERCPGTRREEIRDAH